MSKDMILLSKLAYMWFTFEATTDCYKGMLHVTKYYHNDAEVA